MRFSIIIPVYNVEDYLTKCLDSVVNQTFSDYEVIVVNDETPDNSMAIVEKYAASHPDKFQIIHQKNKGLGGARNTGIATAKGEYLIFVDSDDYIHDQMLETLDRHIQETPCEMLIFNYCNVTPSGTVLAKVNAVIGDKVITRDEKNIQLQHSPSAWNKVYLRSFFMESGVFFPEKLLYEDVITRILTAKAERIRVCEDHLYYYVQRAGSIMNATVSPRVLEIKNIVDLVVEKCKELNLYDEYRDAIDAAMICSLVCIMEVIDKQAAKHPYKAELSQYLKEKFPEYESNPVLLPVVKRKANCLMNRSRTEYYIRFKLIPRIKKTLIKNPVIAKLNDLRKKH